MYRVLNMRFISVVRNTSKERYIYKPSIGSQLVPPQRDCLLDQFHFDFLPELVAISRVFLQVKWLGEVSY